MDSPPLLTSKPTLKQRLLQAFILFTAPGVILHELSHQLICIWQRIPLGEVVYFQLGSPAGYVEHGNPKSWTNAFLLAIAPLFVNIFIATWAFIIAFTLLSGNRLILTFALSLVWLGFAAIVHALPSPQDIKNLWNYTTSSYLLYPLLVLVAPLYALTLLVYKYSMFYVTVPLAFLSIFLALTVFQINPGTVSTCVLSGQWGCWTAPTLFDIIFQK